MIRHEFWIKKYPDVYGSKVACETLPIYRVAFGELIPATDRITFPVSRSGVSFEFCNNSGSIGFMDLSIREERVPKVDAVPIPNPNKSPYLEYQYNFNEMERVTALVILTIGIEPEYWRLGYARQLTQRAAELACERKLNVIVADLIQNEIMRDYVVRLGYVLYDNGVRGVKRLNPTVTSSALAQS